MKKVIIFGGGTGLSQLLKGLKEFPIDVTAVVTVADNGRSTGKLRNEFNIPAVGDITKVLLSMSNVDDDIKELMNYRFEKGTELETHSIKNLIMTSLLEMKGDFKHSIPTMAKMLNIKGNVLPITEENVDLVGITKNGEEIVGEEELTKDPRKIVKVRYNKKISLSQDIKKAISSSDLIVFSSGSLLTSVVPNLLVDGIVDEINKSKAKKIYICNLVTQPGETDNFKVSDHIKFIQKYLGPNSIDAVIANGSKMSNYIVKKYASLEQKDPVKIDESTLKKMNVKVIKDKTWKIEDNYLRHDSLKTAYLIFSYLMENE